MILNTLYLIPKAAYAVSSPWAQTDWSGGSGQTSWSDSTKFDSSSTIDTSTTSGEASLSVAEKLTNTGFASDNSSWSVAAVPPSGWVEVPGNATFGTTNFLAMKYEAKCASTSDLSTGLTSSDTGYQTWPDNTAACTSANSRAVVSVASGYPIANISHTNALTRCSTVSLNGNAAHLMRNDEWMTIARDAEAQTGNWSLGAVGSGYLYAGHNDNSPAFARVASATDTGNNACAYTDSAGTTEAPSSCPTNTASGQSATSGNQKRVFTLSSGTYIWDIAGNVWEHVQRSVNNSGDDTTAINPLPACSDSVAAWGWCQYGSTTTPYVSSWPSAVPATNGPAGSTYNSAQGVGQVYTYRNGTGQNTTVFLRGGDWSATSYTGAFALSLGWTVSDAYYSVGFRCASDPVAISQSFSSTSGRSAGGGNTVTIGSVSDGKIYQSVNVGDTSTYNFSAYVYDTTAGNDGGTVDSNIAQLYYNGSTASTTYTSVGSGWYKLTGTITGVASSVEAGLLVKAGKTVKVDDFSLGNYNSSGTLTSSIFDTEISGGAAWGNLAYSSSGSTVAVKVRTSNSSSMTGATDFSSCTAITSGSDISSDSCATDGHRYIQYQLSLSTADTASTPTFSDISIAFATYDSAAPSISLTALSPDPNTDTTPTLSGTATEAIGTVASVQFQMDATSGTWQSCSAGDGSFDEATETFTCTPSALSDGSHTIYVRATDSNSNTTSNASASSDTFTIDVTSPASFDLDSPGHESYTTNERPTFKWKATTDATSGLSSYTLEVDNGSSGDFSISGIPTSRTTDYDTSKYLVHYDGFSDSDSTNNYISIYTKPSSSWGSSENDGKLKEGSVGWKIKAIDSAGNERSEGRTVIVDLTSPTLSSLSSSDSSGTKDNALLVTSHTPSITGTITDNYSPDKIKLSIYKLDYFLGVQTGKALYTSINYSLSNSANSKSLSFSVPISSSLEYGSYQVEAQGTDKAGNTSATSSLNFKVMTARQAQQLLQGKVSKEEKQTIQEQAQVSLPRLEEKAKERRQKEAEELEKTISPVAESLKSQILTFKTAMQNSKVAVQETADGLVAWTKTAASSALAAADSVLVSPLQNFTAALDDSSAKVQKETAFLFQGRQPAKSADQALRPVADAALAVRDTVGSAASRAAAGAWTGIKEANNALTRTSDSLQNQLAKNNLQKFNYVKKAVSRAAFGIGEKAQNISDRLGFEIVSFGYLFVSEPTRIYDVQVLALTPTSARVSWKTNHPASAKVNYGLDETYPFSLQRSKRTLYHEFTLTDLTPATQYYFEVMSQNKNYVYDANRRFTTPKQ